MHERMGAAEIDRTPESASHGEIPAGRRKAYAAHVPILVKRAGSLGRSS
jgi:hypothetical protein